MNDIVIFDAIEKKILEINGEKVILDSDVAKLYGVATKEINQAASNNPANFQMDILSILTMPKFLTGSKTSSTPLRIQRPLPREVCICLRRS